MREINLELIKDPCKKCIVRASCSEVCDDRFRWSLHFLLQKTKSKKKKKLKGKLK